MGSILATLAMLYGGWKNWPLLSPLYALLLLSPLTAYQLISVRQWRHDAGLPYEITLQNIMLMATGNLLLFVIAFGAARAARNWNNARKN